MHGCNLLHYHIIVQQRVSGVETEASVLELLVALPFPLFWR